MYVDLCSWHLLHFRDKIVINHDFYWTRDVSVIFFQNPSSGGRLGPRYPLFEEFVRWLLCEWRAGNELDMHWTPIANFCTPCQVRFDIIAKFETLHVSIIKRKYIYYNLIDNIKYLHVFFFLSFFHKPRFVYISIPFIFIGRSKFPDQTSPCRSHHKTRMEKSYSRFADEGCYERLLHTTRKVTNKTTLWYV